MADSTGKVSLSVCMMIRDEEENIARCLNSVKDLADEIIIVDTGSKDRTLEIVRSFGPIVKLYEHPWQYDFSYHRNQSTSYASKDWILIVDADEEVLISDSPDKIKRAIAEITMHAGGVIVEDFQKGELTMQFNSSRLFRRGHVRYEGSVHNQPVIIGGESEGVFFPFLKIKHYGYDLTPEKKAAKFKRTHDLLLKRIEKDPRDGMAYFYLSQLHGDNQDPAKSAEYGEKYIEFEKDEYFNGSIYFTMIRNYQAAKNKEKTLEWIRRAAKALPGDLDIAYAMIDFGVWQQDNDIIIRGARNYVNAWMEFEKNPLKSDKRFVYTRKDSCLAFAVFALSMAHYFEAAKATVALNDVVKQLEPNFGKQIIRDFHESMKTISVPINVGFPLDVAEEPQQKFAQASIR